MDISLGLGSSSGMVGRVRGTLIVSPRIGDSAHCVNRDVIDLDDTKDKQIAAFLNADSAYVAFVRRGSYQRLAESRSIERELLRQVLAKTS